MNALDLNLLRVFEALIQERSVSLAAGRLNLTQPAVSNALNRLRTAFDDQMFVRGRAGMEPTPLALALSKPVHEGLAAIRVGIAQGKSFDPARSQRKFSILATDVGELAYLAPLMKSLNREAPGVDLLVMEASLDEYELLLDDGEADLAIGRLRLSNSLQCELVGSAKYVVVMCANHARRIGVAQGSVMPYKIYLDSAHAHLAPRGATQNPIDQALGADAPKRRVALTLPHTSVLSTIIPGTELVATVPQPVVSSLCRGGNLIWAVLPFKTEISRVHIAWHRRNERDKGHVWLRERLRATVIRALSSMVLPARRSRAVRS
ncbi:MAG: LysR family transcriptional regulator [Alphaproteobacteria bacterium]